MTAALGAAVLVAGTTKTTPSSSSGIFYIVLLVGVAFYFFIYRPQQRKAKALREQGNTFDVGDEVLTAGGIVGHVLEIDGDRITLETSVGASFVVLKQYVLRRLEAPVDDTDEDGPGVDDDDQGEHAALPDGNADGDSDEAHDAGTAWDEEDEVPGTDGDGHGSPNGSANGSAVRADLRDDPRGSDGPPTP